MRTIKTLAIVIVGMVLVSASNVRATFTPIGSPEITGSWSQPWEENGVGSFTQIEYLMQTSGVTFENPAFTDFNAAGWVNVPTGSTLAVAMGPAVDDITYDTTFSTDISTSFTMDLYAWDGQTAVDAEQALWSGTAWTVTAIPLNTAPIPVPEVTTMIAGALLLLPLGVSTLRILRRNRMS